MIEEIENILDENGYALAFNIYDAEEISAITTLIEGENVQNTNQSRTKDLFAIRQLLNNIPELSPLIFNNKLLHLINQFENKNYFLSKAIYFDKPKNSNWFVGYHQDLSISVKEREEKSGFINWTFKKGQYGVQPPLSILEDTITIRIHLDDTSKKNGALRVIPYSHKNGITRVDQNTLNTDSEIYCEIKKGGVMLMKPLTLHASSRTTNQKQRRVIHLELSTTPLPSPLQWLEYQKIN